jgi:hypothetical protein
LVGSLMEEGGETIGRMPSGLLGEVAHSLRNVLAATAVPQSGQEVEAGREGQEAGSASEDRWCVLAHQ